MVYDANRACFDLEIYCSIILSFKFLSNYISSQHFQGWSFWNPSFYMAIPLEQICKNLFLENITKQPYQLIRKIKVVIKMKLHESKATIMKSLLNYPRIDPKDIFIVLYIIITRLNAKILKITETIKKGDFVSGEILFKIPEDEETNINLLLDGTSKQLIITCKHKKMSEITDLIRNIKNNVYSLTEKFSKLNEDEKKEIRNLFKILKEIDRTSLSILSQENVEKIYFLLSLLRERICEYTKNLIEISLKTEWWLKILNNLRTEPNTKLGTDIAKKLLTELSRWKEKICERIKI